MHIFADEVQLASIQPKSASSVPTEFSMVLWFYGGEVGKVAMHWLCSLPQRGMLQLACPPVMTGIISAMLRPRCVMRVGRSSELCK